MCASRVSLHFAVLPIALLCCTLMHSERPDHCVMHTDMTICHWHRGQCKLWERCMWQNEKAQRGRATPPLMFTPAASHISFHISIHTHSFVSMTAGFLLSRHSAFHTQKQFIKNYTCPPPVLGCHSLTMYLVPLAAANRRMMFTCSLTGLWLRFYTLWFSPQ